MTIVDKKDIKAITTGPGISCTAFFGAI